MKKLLILFLLLNQTVNAQFKNLLSDQSSLTDAYFLDDCDACGCSASGGSMGFNSMLSEKFIGVRYMYQKYQSRDGVFNNSPWIDENFNTVQLWGRIPISSKMDLMVLAPYHFLNREKMTNSQSLSGLGDITLLTFYNLHQTKNDTATFQHKILVGAGIKVPTGVFNNKNNGSINPSFQLGTGSWDYNLATEYIVRANNFGLNTTLSYVFKTENHKNYKFGNQFNYGSTLFYTILVDQLQLVPQIGAAGETYQANQEFKEDVPYTKGDIFFGKLGIEAGYRKFSAGINVMLPINQNLTGSKVEADYRLAFNINYIL